MFKVSAIFAVVIAAALLIFQLAYFYFNGTVILPGSGVLLGTMTVIGSLGAVVGAFYAWRDHNPPSPPSVAAEITVSRWIKQKNYYTATLRLTVAINRLVIFESLRCSGYHLSFIKTKFIGSGAFGATRKLDPVWQTSLRFENTMHAPTNNKGIFVYKFDMKPTDVVHDTKEKIVPPDVVARATFRDDRATPRRFTITVQPQ